MKTEDFVFAMNETADKFITEPFEEAKEGKIIRFRKWAAVAACICLVLASATVVAAEVFDIGFNLLKKEINDRNGTYTAEGYVLDFEIGTHPQESVGAMEEMKYVLDFNRYGSEYGGIDRLGNHSYGKHFGDLKTAFEYMDFYDFEMPDLNLRNEYISVWLSGYSGEELTSLSVNVYDNMHEIDEPHVILSYGAKLYFEGNETTETISYVGDRGEIFTEEHCVNENGTEYLVVRCITAEGRLRTISAFLIKDDILYKAVINSTEAIYEFTENYSNPEDHIDFIHNWANFY
ncbi:MAG: hypothetical protein E7479_01945 [Ruminococcaceae bacterium]|nr:hypothetical protein [Oscillospiraceae bacterium]